MSDQCRGPAEPSTAMTAKEFCRILVSCYQGKPDDHRVSIGDWTVLEPDPTKMTIYSLPQFNADISITVGELRQMAVSVESE